MSFIVIVIVFIGFTLQYTETISQKIVYPTPSLNLDPKSKLTLAKGVDPKTFYGSSVSISSTGILGANSLYWSDLVDLPNPNGNSNIPTDSQILSMATSTNSTIRLSENGMALRIPSLSNQTIYICNVSNQNPTCTQNISYQYSNTSNNSNAFILGSGMDMEGNWILASSQPINQVLPYLYSPINNTWLLQNPIIPSQIGSNFGACIDIDEKADRAIITQDPSFFYIYTLLNNNFWEMETTIQISELFSLVAVLGDDLAIVSGSNQTQVESGIVYVYQNSENDGWVYIKTLTPWGQIVEGFGMSLSISGLRIAVGLQEGVYTFLYNPDFKNCSNEYFYYTSVPNCNFGYSISMRPYGLLIGAPCFGYQPSGAYYVPLVPTSSPNTTNNDVGNHFNTNTTLITNNELTYDFPVTIFSKLNIINSSITFNTNILVQPAAILSVVKSHGIVTGNLTFSTQSTLQITWNNNTLPSLVIHNCLITENASLVVTLSVNTTESYVLIQYNCHIGHFMSITVISPSACSTSETQYNPTELILIYNSQCPDKENNSIQGLFGWKLIIAVVIPTVGGLFILVVILWLPLRKIVFPFHNTIQRRPSEKVDVVPASRTNYVERTLTAN